MSRNLPDVTDAAQPENRTYEQEIGLIARLLDGDLTTFQFRHLQVKRESESVYVFDPETGEKLGGRWLIVNTKPVPVHEWLDTKAKAYADRASNTEVIA